MRKWVISQIRPLFAETVINIVGSGGTSHTSKDGPTCSGMFPATPNELGHQAIYPLAFKSLSVTKEPVFRIILNVLGSKIRILM